MEKTVEENEAVDWMLRDVPPETIEWTPEESALLEELDLGFDYTGYLTYDQLDDLIDAAIGRIGLIPGTDDLTPEALIAEDIYDKGMEYGRERWEHEQYLKQKNIIQ